MVYLPLDATLLSLLHMTIIVSLVEISDKNDNEFIDDNEIDHDEDESNQLLLFDQADSNGIANEKTISLFPDINSYIAPRKWRNRSKNAYMEFMWTYPSESRKWKFVETEIA